MKKLPNKKLSRLEEDCVILTAGMSVAPPVKQRTNRLAPPRSRHEFNYKFRLFIMFLLFPQIKLREEFKLFAFEFLRCA
jgi:hypothetical protein